MGKKKRSSNNKKKKSNRNQSSTAAAAKTSSSSSSNSSTVKNDKGVYATYKQCTAAVKQWGISTYTELTKNEKSKRKQTADDGCSLTTLFQRLHHVAAAGVTMPHDICRSLRTAIRFRERVSSVYRSVPSANEDDHARHAWIIEQLRLVEGLFLANNRQKGEVGSDDEAHVAARMKRQNEEKAQSSLLQGFAALAVSDDEGSDEESIAENYVSESKPLVSSSAPQSEEELAAEERCFAIACTLMEIAQTRTDIRDAWRDWAKGQEAIGTPVNDVRETDLKRAAGELVAAYASTQYAVRMLRTSVLQTSVEFHSFDDFDQILAAFETQAACSTSVDYRLGDDVTLRRLQARPDLNGRRGIVSDEVRDGRYPIKLDEGRKIVLIKPENLILSDDTFLRLNQVYVALKSFDFRSIPRLENRSNADRSEIETACKGILLQLDNFSSAMKRKDFVSFVELTVRYFLPIWMCYAQLAGDAGAADELLKAYLFDFSRSRKVTFHLAFAILSLADSACVISETKESLGEDAVRIFRKVIPASLQLYRNAIEAFDRHGFKPDCFYSHYQLISLYGNTFYPMCHFFPLLSGEILLRGLRLNLVAASGIVYQFWKEFMTLIHLYWMLRAEGYLGRIVDLEETLIGMYSQRVWFRGGLPERGKCTYWKLWQLSVGLNIQATKAYDGRNVRGAGLSSWAEDRTGLHVTEMSRLLDVLQWKSIPVFDRKACFKQIRAIALEECGAIFMAPLMQVSLQLLALEGALTERFVATAVDFCKRWIRNYQPILRQLKDCPKVCFWAFALADDRADEDEKRAGLTLLAGCFQDVFGAPEGDSQPIPTLSFNPNDHKVDPSLWGEKGARASSYSLI
jgi:hypothetical protein